MNILIGKIGKSIDFKNRESTINGGAVDAFAIFTNLFYKYPQHTFYIMGKSNYHRLHQDERDVLNRNNNVVNLWDDWEDFRKTATDDEFKDDAPSYSKEIKYIHHICGVSDHLQTSNKFDGYVGLFLHGNVLSFSLQGLAKTKDGKYKKTLNSAYSYAAPMAHFLNITGVDYNVMVTDPRCFPIGQRDIFKLPSKILGQINEPVDIEHMTDYDSGEVITETMNIEYAGIETLYAIDYNDMEELDDWGEEPEKTRDLAIFLNEGTPSRYDFVVDYIFNDFDIDIYGSWKDKSRDFQEKFIKKPITQSHDILNDTKYTLCIPITKNWATGKFFDMAKYGMIPFISEFYDTQGNVGIPEYLRVTNSKELKLKINELNADPKKYDKIYNEVQRLLRKSNDGVELSKTIISSLESLS